MEEPKTIIVKILDINIESLTARLNELKVRQLFEHVLTKTLVFDHPQLRLRQSGKVLRLRQVGSKVFLSIKAGQTSVAHNPFHKVQDSELAIDDFTLAFKLLESLGFSAFRYQEKIRSGYITSQGVKLEITQYPKIPPYLEIEVTNEKMLHEIIGQLDFSKDQVTKLSPLEILKHYGLRDVDIIRFPESQTHTIL